MKRWRNSPRLERWPVAVQWTQTKRSTGAGGAGVTVIPYMGPMMGELNRPAGVQKKIENCTERTRVGAMVVGAMVDLQAWFVVQNSKNGSCDANTLLHANHEDL